MEGKKAEAEKATVNYDMYQDLLVNTKTKTCANSTALLEAERTTEAMLWFYNNSSCRSLNRSERLISQCSALRFLNQTQLQQVFQTFSIEDFQSMNWKEILDNYARLLIRGGHEKKDSISKVMRATGGERKGTPYGRLEELQHILADIFGFDVVPHAPLNHH